MAPKPKPLDQGEILVGNSFGSTDEGATLGNPTQVGVMSLEHQENLGPASQQYHNENLQPLSGDNSGAAGPIIHSPIRTTPWYLRNQQRDPNGHKMSRKSVSPSNTAACGMKHDPPETRQITSASNGIMMREGDFLDRTFDNVENVTCHRTSISKAPPAPIFSCSAPGNEGSLEAEEAFDLAALSLAKQQGYKIEQYDEYEEEGHEVPLPTQTAGRPPLVPVNSMLEERQSGIRASESANTERAVVGPKRDMLDYIFENVHGIMCREERSLAIRPEDTRQIEMAQQPGDQPQQRQPEIAVDNDGESGEPSPLNLHNTVPGQKSDGLVSGCDSLFAGRSSADFSESASRKSSANRRDPFAPIQYQDETPSTNGSKPRTGMMLLADGSIVVPGEHTNEWIERRRRRAVPYSAGGMSTASSNRPPSQSNSSVRVSRESSLLDMVSRSGDASDDETSRVRQQKRVQTNGRGETIIFPRQSFDEEEVRVARGSSKVKGPVSAQDMERQHFWKQVVFATTILLLACGLIVFAMSFFWPTHKMT
jgi:hypothetical protein